MIRWQVSRFALSLLSWVVTGSAMAAEQVPIQTSADEDIAILEGNVTETVGDKANISSPMIAGLVAGPFIATVDFTKLRFAIPASGRPTQLCFSAASRDGAYSATLNGGSLVVKPGQRLVRPPLNADAQGRLQRYGVGDIAIRGRIGVDCATSSTATFVPAAYRAERSNLNVMLLSRNAPAAFAELIDRAGASARATCVKNPNVVSVRFDMVCSIPLAGLSLIGTSVLKITLQDRRGNKSVEVQNVAW